MTHAQKIERVAQRVYDLRDATPANDQSTWDVLDGFARGLSGFGATLTQRPPDADVLAWLGGVVRALRWNETQAQQPDAVSEPAPAADLNIDVLDVASSSGVDSITVFWRNYQPGKGSVTITCYGSAWTAYFGAMSGQTIQQFFARADTDYLVTKLGITPELKQRKRDHEYLARIIDAVKAAMRAESEGRS
jgi:hypothetical protein